MAGKATITDVAARQVLDSRGNPTLAVRVWLSDGVTAEAYAPSGASTGTREAVELRDRDMAVFRGKGVLKAVAMAKGAVRSRLLGMEARHLAAVDAVLAELDQGPEPVGANTTTATSLAVARAAAESEHLPFYKFLGGGERAPLLPMPQFNVLNGGAHAKDGTDFQEYMFVPVGATSFAQALRMGAECFHALRDVLAGRGLPTSQGDEGGFAPPLAHNEDALELLCRAVEQAGYACGEDVAFALDPAASELWRDGAYHLEREGVTYSSAQMVDLWERWIGSYPIVSLEDGMAEQDWDGWRQLTERLGSRVQLVGDDIFVTNPTIFQEGVDKGIANALLVKVNQIGTLSETLQAMQIARRASYGLVISHRSGETEDTSIADLAVGTAAGQIKSGAPSRSERVAKYNRLLAIEEELGAEASFSRPFLAVAPAQA